MEKELLEYEPLRVVLIGLSYAGKKVVAEMLREHYEFKIYKL